MALSKDQQELVIVERLREAKRRDDDTGKIRDKMLQACEEYAAARVAAALAWDRYHRAKERRP